MNRISKPWIMFKGVRSDEVGALMIRQPVIAQTAITGEKIPIPRMDGYLFSTDDVYQPITISQDFAVPDKKNLGRVLNWLSGYGQLVFYDDEEKYYDAVIMNTFKRQAITNRLEGQKFTIPFTCQPFKRERYEGSFSTDGGSLLLQGMGDVTSYPLVEVRGSGDTVITINGIMIRVNLTPNTPLYLDCEHRLAYEIVNDRKEFAGSKVILINQIWFELKPDGNNLISVDNGGSATITPHWRWF